MLSLMKRLLVTALVVVLATTACSKKKDGDDDDDDAAGGPGTPAPYTLSIDTSVSEGGSDVDAQAAGLVDVNAVPAMATANAHLGASVFTVVITANLAAQVFLPVLLLKTASKTKATKVSDGVFLWSFDFQNGGATYTGNLTGTEGEGGNAWSMKVTKAPADGNACCTDFEFFTGSDDGKGNGSWQLYDPTRPTAAAKLFSVTYAYASPTAKTLAYQVNSDRAAEQKFGGGTTVVYNIKDSALTLTYKDSSEQGSRVITWHKTTKAGSIVDLQGTKLCWDTKANGYADIACP